MHSIHGFEKVLRSLFYSYGGFIARHPLYFVIIPLLVAIGLGSGMLFLDTTSDLDGETLYAPENSRASRDRSLIQEIYSTNVATEDDEMLPQHLTEPGLYGQVVVTLKDRGNVLIRNVTDEVLRLHRIVESLSVEFASERYSYRDLCMKWQNSCLPIGIIQILNNTMMAPELSLQYPKTFMTFPFGSIPVFIGGEVAGVTLKSDSSEVETAEAIQLTYNLQYNSEEEKEIGLLWEREFQNTVVNFQSMLDLELFWTTSATLQDELDKSTSNIIGKFSVAFCTLIVFAIATCAMMDWVRSKTWLASLGVWSAGLAVMASFGLLIYLGVPFVNVVGSTPFLIIGECRVVKFYA